MKKIILFLLIFFSFSLTVNADAGNNVRYSRQNSSKHNSVIEKSRDNYSRNHRRELSSDSYSSSSRGGSLPSVDILGIIAIAGLLFLLKYKGKFIQSESSHYDTIEPNSTSNQKNESKVENRLPVNDEIVKSDPLFDEKAFLSYAEEVYIKLQHAWTRKDWKEVRQYESESLYQIHSEQLQEYIQKQITNVVERIGIKESSLYEFRSDSLSEYLTVRMSVVLRDYIIDDATKKVLEGNSIEDLDLNYELVFVRKKGQQTRENHVMYALECPSCGSKNGINEKGICDYCGYQRSNDWVLNSIKTI